jgi:type I restriction enzyme, S subunit
MNNLKSNNFIQTTLGELVSKEKKSIISGPFGSNIGKIFFKEKGIPVIRGNNLSTGGEKFKDDGFVFVTREKANELNCYAIKNDLIFTAVGTIGQVGIIDEKLKYDEYVISNKQLRVRFDNDKITPLFAYYWFSSYWIQKLIVQRNVGSTVPLINLSVLKGLPITLPKSIDVQNGIVQVLENISAKIELNNKINSELEAMAKTLYDYWFVQFDFPYNFAQGIPDKNGKPYKSSGGKMVWNEVLKREVPEGWSIKNINEIIEVKDGTHDSPKPRSQGYRLITSKNLKVGGLDFEDANFISEEDYESVNKRSKVETGDILFSMIGNIGTIYKIEEEEINFAIKNVALYKTSQNLNLKNFIYMYLRSYDMKKHMQNVISGSIQKFIGLGSLREMSIFINPQCIEMFDKRTSSLFRKLNNLKLENQKLVELRDWLLPMLMNGQVKVK